MPSPSMVPSSLLLLCFAALARGSESAQAYSTWHPYTASDPLTSVSCSDGANGLITRWGYATLEPMFPYVAAMAGASWNSPKCGTCVCLIDDAGAGSVCVTVIDSCGARQEGTHFDIAESAFTELFGPAGIHAGHGFAQWQESDASKCKGNKGSGDSSSTTNVPITTTGGVTLRSSTALASTTTGSAVDTVTTTNPSSCTDSELPIAWSGGGVHTCLTYEQHGGTAYCAHQALAEACCFCKASRRLSSQAYSTWHPYSASDLLTSVSCSDGANGLITRWGYETLEPMFPYVAAMAGASWNSPKCGTCVCLTDDAGAGSVCVTVIDSCGARQEGLHFDIAESAFTELFGSAGIHAGHGFAQWHESDPSKCKGNKGSGDSTSSTNAASTTGATTVPLDSTTAVASTTTMSATFATTTAGSSDCTDSELPAAWSGGGVHTCSTYEQHGGTAYCAHKELADACCFCKGSRRLSSSRRSGPASSVFV